MLCLSVCVCVCVCVCVHLSVCVGVCVCVCARVCVCEVSSYLSANHTEHINKNKCILTHAVWVREPVHPYE